MAPQLGELRVRDVRGGLAAAGHRGGEALVFVLGIDGEAPFIGRVGLGTKRSGHGEHLALVCPTCAQPKSVLYARRGQLACAGCSGRRTRRQAERTLAAWNRGGREEDRLLRMVGKGRAPKLLRALVGEIIEGDLDRASVIDDDFHGMIACIEARS
jgi:hypothetical protein